MKETLKNDALSGRLEQAWDRLRESSQRYGKLSFSTAETCLQFVYTYESFSAYLSRKARQQGLTRAGLNVLTLLRGSEKSGCRQNQISRLLLVSRANVTGLVASLIGKGLVERVYDAKDRRVCIAKITPKGAAFLDSFLPEYHAAIEAAFSTLNAEDKRSLNRLMEKLQTAINEPKDDRSL
ncbi:MAG: MarR family transcriptional regulator [Candidatus Omnitrophica bacterium]|nr:MarR family transcriptional regulator [Candidatus Omnitrophota bacterium]